MIRARWYVQVASLFNSKSRTYEARRNPGEFTPCCFSGPSWSASPFHLSEAFVFVFYLMPRVFHCGEKKDERMCVSPSSRKKNSMFFVKRQSGKKNSISRKGLKFNLSFNLKNNRTLPQKEAHVSKPLPCTERLVILQLLYKP